MTALQELKAALEADNEGGSLTIGEMDKTRSEYRIKENPVLDAGRVNLSEARKRQIYRTMTDDLYANIEAVDPNKAAKLKATKTKDALYHRLLEKRFAETITNKAEKGEYAEIAKGLVTHKQFADPQMYADLKKALGGEQGGGWLSLKSYYLQTLLESAQTRKSTDTAPRFSVTGLNNALRKNKEAYRQLLGDEMADSLDALSERLVGMGEFIGSIEGSQTAYNEAMIQSLFGAAGDIGRAGKLPAVTAAAAVTAQKVGEVVMGSFDGMWDWQATALALGTGLVTLVGQDAYMAFRGKGTIAGIPAKMLPDVEVVNHLIERARDGWQESYRDYVTGAARAARVAAVSGRESERRAWDPEMSSVLPGQHPPLD